jgi:TolB-like protein/DNA-binding winged helix-turn-helix (wHTH) protein/Tfp pilus assembly protein PilF
MLRFGVFELDLGTGELRKSGRRLKLPPQPFKVLALIASHRGELISREEIQRQLWGTDTFVDFEQGMNHCVKQIRNALGDNAETPRYVETVPRRGYRFVAPVEEVRTSPLVLSREVESVPPPTGHAPWRLIAAIVLVVAGAVAGAFWLVGGRKGFQSSAEQPSIAVLPFVDMSSEKNEDYFSDGLTEEVLNALARIPGLRVTARTSSFQFKGKAEDSRVIGKKLNVANLLEGSVRKQGSRARISVQLIKAADGFHLWSETYDREMNDIFATEEQIAHAVTAKLQVTLLGAKTAAPSAKSVNAEAHTAFLQGRYFLGRRNKQNLEKAASYFEQAIKLDSGYAPALVGLGQTRVSQADSDYVPVEEGFREAREAIERALRLDKDLAAAHSAMAYIKMTHDWDWGGADTSFRRALELEPGNAATIGGAASLARALGHLDEATTLYRQAMQIDPLNSSIANNAGIAFYYAGQPKEAMVAIGKALELAPDRVIAHCLLGRIDLMESDAREALAEAEKETAPSYRLSGLALANHALGRKKESDANLAELIAKFQKTDPYQIAEVYAFRGEKDEAFEWLERSYRARDAGLSEIKGDPLLRSLQPDPRYAAFLKKMRLV